ncbi:V-set domain-containing T-cell activation inhibitor 1-like [Astatotilapia calliptera]|uniref:V-set domain-containing T-cell activation inhibitor 1-like n=1 Tax=Astatotilapia calliptera TaxID=8154 RepID=UPI000E3FC3EB|nr:V-set domain-containing T-cell activation inhibitor 1-like [Astatotilapia calliptera]
MSHILLLLLLTFETAASQDITVRCGQDVALHCQDPRGVNITLLEWSIPEIKSDGYVFFYRNRRSYESYQHERFKGRVELSDPSMNNGNVSVILKNVNVNDTGTYECRIITSDLSSGQRVQSESRQSIDLTVIDSGSEDEQDKKTFLLAIGIVAVVLSLFVILSAAVCIHRKKKSSTHREHEHYKHPPEKELI